MRKNALGTNGTPAAGAAALACLVEEAQSNPMVSAIAVTVPALLRKARRAGSGGMNVCALML
jgi:hypothetical protein